MKIRLKKYFLFILIPLFLFPQIEKAIHDYQHRNDFHCPIHDITHFHETEHHCGICDYTLPPAEKAFVHIEKTGDVNFTKPVFHFYQFVDVQKHNYNFSLRGPPTVS